MSKLSIVIAVYNEGEPLVTLCDRINDSVSGLFDEFEILLVDDRSTDNSWSVIKRLCSERKYIKGMRFIRNFGQHSALTAGIENASGDYIVLMDCDQQDEPENIPKLYKNLIDKDLQIVYAVRVQRKDKWVKIFSSWLINRVLEILTGYKHNHKVGTYRIFTHVVRESLLAMPEKKKYIAGMFYWLGFEYDLVEVKHQTRANGESKYTLRKQLKLARLGILSSSTKLLSIGIYIGFFTAILAVIMTAYYLYMKLFYNVPLGYSSLIVSMLFIGGAILIVLGILGEYLREIVDEVKARPNHIIENKINF